MKESKYSFAEGFLGMQGEKKGGSKMFDWDKAAAIIKEKLKTNPDLIAEAGLQGDWNYTGGVIFENGKPVLDSYLYLSSTWAIPSLEIDGVDVPCWIEGGDAKIVWPDSAIKILTPNPH